MKNTQEEFGHFLLYAFLHLNICHLPKRRCLTTGHRQLNICRTRRRNLAVALLSEARADTETKQEAQTHCSCRLTMSSFVSEARCHVRSAFYFT
jgi:hypothetical protein